MRGSPKNLGFDAEVPNSLIPCWLMAPPARFSHGASGDEVDVRHCTKIVFILTESEFVQHSHPCTHIEHIHMF